MSEDTPARTITSRRALPNGRAVVGALLITLAAVGAFVVATRGGEGPTDRYVILVDEVRAGDVISLDRVTFAAMELTPQVSSNALQSTDGLEGATALAHLHAGTLLDVRDLNGALFVDGAPLTSVHELTLPVQRDRAPASLRRGDRVTLLAYASDGVLRTALEDALVISFDAESAGFGSSDEARLTLALASAADVAAATVSSYDSLTVVLTSRAVDDDYPTHTTRQPA